MVLKVFPVSTEISVEGPPMGQWTYADWEKLPDDGNIYEVINGVLYRSTSPSLFHNSILLQLYDTVGYPARQQKIAHIFVDGVGVLMPNCDPVRPDFVVVLAGREEILFQKRVRGVPDLIAEILSPSNADYDEGVKLEAYASAGLPEYAVIDPFKHELRLYELDESGHYGAPRIFRENDMVTFRCLPTISFRLGQLFEGAPTSKL
jgi:Uma2 family endonuclease